MEIYSAQPRTSPTIFSGRLGQFEERYLDFCRQIVLFTAKAVLLTTMPLVAVVSSPVASWRISVRVVLWLLATAGLYVAKYSLYFMGAVAQAALMVGMKPDHFCVAAVFEACEIAQSKLCAKNAPTPKPQSDLAIAVGCVVFVVAIVPLTLLTLPATGWVPRSGAPDFDLKDFIAAEIAILQRAFVLFVPVVIVPVALWLLLTHR